MTVAKTVLESVEVNVATGQTFIQWRKQLFADDGTLMFNEAHRTSLQPQRFAIDHLGRVVGALPLPATNRTAHLDAVDAHLQQMGWPAMSPADRGIIASQDAPRLAFAAVRPIGV